MRHNSTYVRSLQSCEGLVEGQVPGEVKGTPVACQERSEVEEDQIFLLRFGMNRRALQPAGQTLSAWSFSSRSRALAHHKGYVKKDQEQWGTYMGIQEGEL